MNNENDSAPASGENRDSESIRLLVGSHPCDGCECKNECGDCCGPAKLWRRRPLSDWQIPTLKLDAKASRKLERELNFLLHGVRPQTDEEWIVTARAAAAILEARYPDLPGHLRQVSLLGGPVAALVTNLPIGTSHNGWELSQLVCLACASFAGKSFEYSQQAGSLLSNLTTATGLPAHCDDGFLPLHARAEQIGLFCASNETDALTTITPVSPVADMLDEADWETLHDSRNPRFRIKGPPGVKLGGRELWSEPTSVLFSSGSQSTAARLTIRRGCRAAKTGDREAENALDRLFAQFEDPAVQRSICLQPGMFLLISNLYAVHSRTAASRLGARLLFRSLIRRELRSLGAPASPGGRVFDIWHAFAAAQ